VKANFTALTAGVVFGVGLGVAGMTQPDRIIGFLDVAGTWNASLAFVMMGALAVHVVLLRVVRRRGKPLFDTELHLPTRKDIDPRLVAGAAIFGVGWGLAGYCPGPALVTLGSASPAAILFVAAMAIGMVAQHMTDAKRNASTAVPQAPNEGAFIERG
jgi:uncharacterized membrane protein YedE/YeeE